MLLTGCERRDPGIEGEADFFPAVTTDGRPAWRLVLSPQAWAVIAHPPPDPHITAIAQMHRDVANLISAGVAKNNLTCDWAWQVSDMEPTKNGGVEFTGYCGTQEESAQPGVVRRN
jgi:hypothetical protein